MTLEALVPPTTVETLVPLDGGPNDTTLHAHTDRDSALQLTVAGGLVAAVTHDLRQPLTALEMDIAAALKFLEEPHVQLDGARESLQDALTQQRRMRESLQVLDDLAVRREPLREAVDAGALVRDVVALVGSDAMARHASFDLKITPPVGTVFGDATLMRQAFLNMVLDALEATSLRPQHEKIISLTVRQEDSDTVEVAISHYGLRAEAAAIDGWGLALARSVVVAHGGTIALEGDADAGVRLVSRWPTHSHAVPGSTYA